MQIKHNLTLSFVVCHNCEREDWDMPTPPPLFLQHREMHVNLCMEHYRFQNKKYNTNVCCRVMYHKGRISRHQTKRVSFSKHISRTKTIDNKYKKDKSHSKRVLIGACCLLPKSV